MYSVCNTALGDNWKEKLAISPSRHLAILPSIVYCMWRALLSSSFVVATTCIYYWPAMMGNRVASPRLGERDTATVTAGQYGEYAKGDGYRSSSRCCISCLQVQYIHTV
ncbi:hypothetical protein K504DRAFT_144394 [Pleomassaria siparia CBS 279.74]|uniref:Uncharacterized protein n=1 Tax=Pleomassaria siparia CBS 279.74 TaxID=1314801 RepID=A0A6G1KLC7_9PLEO|nr:hypothetical protein K504DRAFT_144394 [Pleomassaria siparia CBS 279.74]